MTGKFTASFFNADLPCPPEIDKCDELRSQYFAEVQSRQARGGCSNCVLAGIKAKYMKLIWEQYTNNLIKTQQQQKPNILL